MEREIKTLLQSLSSEWAKHKNEKVRKAASLLNDCLKTSGFSGKWDDTRGYKCSPPLLDGPRNDKDIATSALLSNTRKVNNALSWKIPLQIVGGDANKLKSMLGSLDALKSAMIVGDPVFGAQFTSKQIYAGLVWLAPGTHYPPHAHHAMELYHVISGIAKWGPTEEFLEVRRPGEVFIHQPAQPHMMVVPENEFMLAAYAWIEDGIDGSYWWCDSTLGKKYTDVGSVKNSQEYYDDMAEDYETVVRAWGYNCPELVANKVHEYIPDCKAAHILDIGCGDGLVAEALSARGFTNMMGLDISDKMVQLARAKNLYTSVMQADLMRPLHLSSCSQDVLTCVGVTTYLEPHVIVEWCKVVRSGGYLVFTVKTAVLEKWKNAQDDFENKGIWKKAYESEPLFYLPTLRNPSQERVYIFVYRKL